MGVSLISWGSTKQKVVSLSTCEAELRALVDGSRELFAMLAQLEFALGTSTGAWTIDVQVRCDSQAAINVIFKGRSNALRYLRKSVAVNLAWVSLAVADWLVKVESALNRADIYTKCVEDEGFAAHVDGSNVRPAGDFGLEPVDFA